MREIIVAVIAALASIIVAVIASGIITSRKIEQVAIYSAGTVTADAQLGLHLGVTAQPRRGEESKVGVYRVDIPGLSEPPIVVVTPILTHGLVHALITHTDKDGFSVRGRSGDDLAFRDTDFAFIVLKGTKGAPQSD